MSIVIGSLVKIVEFNRVYNDYYEVVSILVSSKFKISSLPTYISEEDVVQEVFIRLWRLLENKFDPDLGPLDNFIRGHLHYCIMGTFSTIRWNSTGKKGSRRPQRQALDRLSVTIEGLSILTDTDEDSRIDMDTVYSGIISKLRGRSVDIFNMLVFDEKNQNTIAKELGISEGAVSLQLHNNIRPVVEQVLRHYNYLN